MESAEWGGLDLKNTVRGFGSYAINSHQFTKQNQQLKNIIKQKKQTNKLNSSCLILRHPRTLALRLCARRVASHVSDKGDTRVLGKSAEQLQHPQIAQNSMNLTCS